MAQDDRTVPVKTPSSRATAVDRVVDHVREGVRLSRYVPGQRLPEVDMTRELGVSRGPLREAMARLAAEGVVEIEPYRGATVRRLTEDDLHDLYQVREALEGQAAALAARRISAGADSTELAAELCRLRDANDALNVHTYMAENIAFHEVIINLSSNVLLKSLMSQLQTNVFRIQLLNAIPPDALYSSVQQHTEITQAIMSGHAEEAESAMRHHVRESYALMLRQGAALLI